MISKKKIEAYKERRKKYMGKQVDNASLSAGSCMYYYCRRCGEMTDFRSEMDFGGDFICRICNSCKELENSGYFK